MEDKLGIGYNGQDTYWTGNLHLTPTLSMNIVKDCIVDEKNQKVVIKFTDGDTQVAIATDGDVFSAEVGVLWATMKHLMKKYGTCSAHKFVESCLKKDQERKQKRANGELKRSKKKTESKKGSDETWEELWEETCKLLKELGVSLPE